jgi:rsbT co-antagonist protein RsbR
MKSNILSKAISQNQSQLLEEWLKELSSSGLKRDDRMKEGELRAQCREFLELLGEATEEDKQLDTRSTAWAGVGRLLSDASRSRAVQGFSPSETASFVFSLKKPLFATLQKAVGEDAGKYAQEVWTATNLIDTLGLMTTEAFQKERESVILRQQQEMLELSTPVVTLWDGILALPMIGTLDSARTQVVMETLLTKIAETGSAIAIIDITGVPTVDTLVAQHLIKTVTAARLMGAECIISGIRPQIAQTIVHLGVDLSNIITKASLADAFAVALKRSHLRITAMDIEKKQD